MSRINQINSLLQSQIANIISTQINLKDGLISVTYVDCAPNLSSAKIGVSIVPEKFYGQALSTLRKNTGLIKKELAKNTKIRKIPNRLTWIIDDTEKFLAETDLVFEKIAKEN